MNWLDVAILALILWFTFAAFQAGFIRESVTVVAAVLGVVLAGMFYVDLADDMLTFVDSERLARIIAFAVLFASTALAGQMFALVLKPAVDSFQLGVFDQLAGAIFGFGKAIIFTQVFLILFITYPKWDMNKTINRSFIGAILIKDTPALTKILPDEFRLSVDGFKTGLPASLPDRPTNYDYQAPGNIPPSFNNN